MHVILFLYGKRRDYKQDNADCGKNTECHSPGSESGHTGGFKAVHDKRADIAERAAGYKEKRAYRICVNSHRAVLHKLGNERIVRNHIQSKEKIISPHKSRNPNGIKAAYVIQRHKEHKKRAKSERNSRLLHKRNTSAVFVFALVGACRYKRIGDGVDYMPHRLNQAYYRKDSENYSALRNKIRYPRLL